MIMEILKELYKKITNEDLPNNVKLSILSLEDYVKNYRDICNKKPSIGKYGKDYVGNIEYTRGDSREHHIVVLNNVEDILIEAISHGIGHVKHTIEFYKKNPLGSYHMDVDNIVRETCAHTAVQRVLKRTNSKEYVKTRYYYHTSQWFDSEDKPGADYTAKLIQKYGIDKTWNKVLIARRERELKRMLTNPLFRLFI